MRIIELDIDKYFTTIEFDPSPHRFNPNEKSVSERTTPIVYTCETCEFQISIKTEDFKNQNESHLSNLNEKENKEFEDYIKLLRLSELSRLDFHCPKCKQSTLILFKGGNSGYWGLFEFKIKGLLVLKDS